MRIMYLGEDDPQLLAIPELGVISGGIVDFAAPTWFTRLLRRNLVPTSANCHSTKGRS